MSDAVTESSSTTADRNRFASVLAHIYMQSFRRLRSHATRYAGDEAEDVVHDAVVRALQRGSSCRGDAKASAWLWRITINTCIDRYRRHKARPPMVDLDIRLLSSQPQESDVFQAALVGAALRTLSPNDRRLCLMRFVDGLSHQEIAAEFDIPVGTSKSRLSRARRQLRRVIHRRIGAARVRHCAGRR